MYATKSSDKNGSYLKNGKSYTVQVRWKFLHDRLRVNRHLKLTWLTWTHIAETPGGYCLCIPTAHQILSSLSFICSLCWTTVHCIVRRNRTERHRVLFITDPNIKQTDTETERGYWNALKTKTSLKTIYQSVLQSAEIYICRLVISNINNTFTEKGRSNSRKTTFLVQFNLWSWVLLQGARSKKSVACKSTSPNNIL